MQGSHGYLLRRETRLFGNEIMLLRQSCANPAYDVVEAHNGGEWTMYVDIVVVDPVAYEGHPVVTNQMGEIIENGFFEKEGSGYVVVARGGW
jgi:hypothetical protein